jgi:hypothetical protein
LPYSHWSRMIGGVKTPPYTKAPKTPPFCAIQRTAPRHSERTGGARASRGRRGNRSACPFYTPPRRLRKNPGIPARFGPPRDRLVIRGSPRASENRPLGRPRRVTRFCIGHSLARRGLNGHGCARRLVNAPSTWKKHSRRATFPKGCLIGDFGAGKMPPP